MSFYRYICTLLIALTITACGSPQPAQAATNGQVVEFLLSQVRASGVALSGGKVYFYAPGTLIAKKVWLDRGKTTEASNPYTLDSNATAQIYGDGLYRIIIKDSAGVTKYDRDNISIRDISGNVYSAADYASLNAAVTAIGSTPSTLEIASDVTVTANLVIPSTLELMPLNGAKINHGTYTIGYAGSTARWPDAHIFNGTGAITLTKAPEIKVGWMGAVADGVTDNTAAIQKALATAQISTVGKVTAGPGVYLTGKIDWPGNNLTLKGSGSGYGYNSAATVHTTFKAKTGTTIVFDLVQTGGVDDRTGNHLVDFQVDGASIANVGIDTSGANIIERVRVTRCVTAGIKLENYTNSTRIINCGLTLNGGWGLQAEGAGTTTYAVIGTIASLNTAGGFDLQGGVGVKFSHVVSESNGGPGLRIYRPNVHTGAFSTFDFDTVWIEDNGATGLFSLVIGAETVAYERAPARIKFRNCRINTSQATRKYMSITCGRWITFEDTQFATSTQNDAITFTSEARYVSFINSTETIDLFGITYGISAAQIDSAIAAGSNCYVHDKGIRRTVGAGAPSAPFENSWMNYGTYGTAQYWFDAQGRVHISGVIKSGTIGQAAFTLPAGYRPAAAVIASTDSNAAHGQIIVGTDGKVYPNAGSNVQFALDVSFATD